MGKSGDQTRPVFDYHLSMDYGICMGPIDHINKVWIKDKTIFCGTYYTRTDVSVNLPELFGGDDAEGGVQGVIEIYTGTEEQLSSWELTRRWGRTPLDAPGYRGISHLFFRGPISSDVVMGEISESDDPTFYESMLNIIKDSVGAGLDTPTNRVGWKWTANNPYLPDVKVSVTRLPKIGFADEWCAIWPPARIDDDGNLVGLAEVDQVEVEGGGPDVGSDSEGKFEIGTRYDATSSYFYFGLVDLYELGFSQSQIDTGQAKIKAPWSLTVKSTETYGLGSVDLTTEIKFYSGSPVDGWDGATEVPPRAEDAAKVSITETFTPAGGYQIDGGSTIATESILSTALPLVTAPAGSRFLRVRGSYEIIGNAIFVSPVNTEEYLISTYERFPETAPPGTWGYGDIDVSLGDPPPEPEPEPGTDNAPPNTKFRPIMEGTMKIRAVPPDRRGVIVDLLSLGFSEAEIDAGRIFARSLWTGVTYETIPSVPSGDSYTSATIKFHAEYPAVVYAPTISTASSGPVNGSIHEHDIPLTALPAGTRFVQFVGDYTSAVGQTTDVIKNEWEIGYYSYATYHCAADDLIGPLPDANPARIIYDCLTNGEWGKGEHPVMIDIASFNSCAETLWNERFGLSFAFFEQDSIENFVAEVLDHIQAFLFQDPETGLWTMTLLRDDYDADSLDTLDETNCIAENRKRQLWGETINEIVVSYTDPHTEKPATVGAHDLGNIAIQGGVISETREYYGIRNPLLAQVVAHRDVRASGYPLFSCQIKVNRSAWNLRPGDVRKFSWPEDGIEQMVVRIMSVDYGKPTDRTITLNVVEDIFSIEKSRYGAPQTTEWVNVERAPSPIDAQAAFTVPLPALIRAGQSVEEVDERYPVVDGILMADEDDLRPQTIEVWSSVVRNNGSTAVQKISEITPTYSVLLPFGLIEEVESQIPRSQIDAILRRAGEEGEFFVLGYQDEYTEIIMLDSFDSTTKKWTVKRGMWDTIPLRWRAGVRLWQMTENPANVDSRGRVAGGEVVYNLLPRTSLGTLKFENSVPLVVTYSERPFAPFRPANTQINGQGFGGIVVREAPFPTEITATWKNRNRLTEDQVSLSWDDDSAVMEPGQSVTLRILDATFAEHGTITGLTGESHVIGASLLPPGLEGYIEFLSERDGFVSVFGAMRYFDIRPPSGYGLAYGIDYGSTDR